MYKCGGREGTADRQSLKGINSSELNWIDIRCQALQSVFFLLEWQSEWWGAGRCATRLLCGYTRMTSFLGLWNLHLFSRSPSLTERSSLSTLESCNRRRFVRTQPSPSPPHTVHSLTPPGVRINDKRKLPHRPRWAAGCQSTLVTHMNY